MRDRYHDIPRKPVVGGRQPDHTVLAVAIPAGIVFVIVKETIVPTPVDSDLGFWIALTAAYGIAWVGLGYQIRLTERSINAATGASPSR